MRIRQILFLPEPRQLFMTWLNLRNWIRRYSTVVGLQREKERESWSRYSTLRITGAARNSAKQSDEGPALSVLYPGSVYVSTPLD
jgi:hypothetical protein